MIDLVLTLNETNRTDRGNVERRICGSNLMMANGEMATSDADREAKIASWIKDRGEDQHGGPLELISYAVERIC